MLSAFNVRKMLRDTDAWEFEYLYEKKHLGIVKSTKYNCYFFHGVQCISLYEISEKYSPMWKSNPLSWLVVLFPAIRLERISKKKYLKEHKESV